jgi:peptide methionine sulfoxide reductase msrA/msrB
MKILGIIILVLGVAAAVAAVFVGVKEKKMTYNKLTDQEEQVIVHKGTERPFTGKYLYNKEAGTYVCRRCGAQLYRSSDKFDSGCGWPSFDDEIKGAVKHVPAPHQSGAGPDADGERTEIICARCGAHLGHVFTGEGLTKKNIRHCVNSVSLGFVPAAKSQTKETQVQTKKAYFAGGCFWGVEYWFKKEEGVVSARSGYMGGHTEKPTYKEVCGGKTGHAETVEVEYDPGKVSYEELTRLFFEIHDPTQKDMQGPDVGRQYRSAIFYTDQEQKIAAVRLIEQLRKKGFKIVTEVEQAGKFWVAEEEHQDYYGKTGGQPYCHIRTKRF